MLIILLLIPFPAQAFERYNRVTKFDKYFSKYSKRYFGVGFDWHYFKAQAIAESNLTADARSRAGALGVMQIMPGTFEEIIRKQPTIKGTREQPRWNIAAGIYYDRVLWKAWKVEKSLSDRINFMFGSYNAGRRNILRAQKAAEKQDLNPNVWTSIERTLFRVTGKHSQETIGYISKIHKIKEVLR